MNRTLPLLSCAMAFAAASFAQDLSMGLSVNGSVKTTLDRGRPLIVSVAIYARTGTPVMLALGNGNHWASALMLTVDKDGTPVEWPLQMVPPDEDTTRLQLEGGASAQATWLIAPENTAQLGPGRYNLRLSFGNNTAPPATVELRESPAEPNEDNDAANAILESHYQELTSNLDAAFAAVDSLLERYPTNLRTLGRKAGLLSDAGRYSEAVSAYNVAIRVFKDRFPDATHPPRELLYLRNECRWKQLQTDGTIQ